MFVSLEASQEKLCLDSNSKRESQSQITKLFEIVKEEDIKFEEDKSIESSDDKMDKISPMIESI